MACPFSKTTWTAHIPAPPIDQTLDFRFCEVGPGCAVFAGTPDHRVCNPIGTVHGGYTATLLGSCMACAVHSTLTAGEGSATREIKVNCVHALTDAVGEVSAVGNVSHRGSRSATSEGRLVDANGRLYAHGTTACMILKMSGDSWVAAAGTCEFGGETTYLSVDGTIPASFQGGDVRQCAAGLVMLESRSISRI